MKYKVGDKVKIRKGSLAGNIYTISHIESCGHIELSDLPYVFFDYELEPVNADGGKIAYAPNGAPLFWKPEPEKTVSIEEQLGLPKGIVSIHDIDTHEVWTTPFIIPKDKLDALVGAWAKLGYETVNLVRDEVKEVIKKTEEKKMPTKFTFYVTEGTRIDKSCNKTVPTMTTEVIYRGNDGCAISGTATCDKTDYNERDGVLNAIANAVVGGNFDREFNKAVKANVLADKKKRTCTYCGQVFDTVEEKQAHEAWHVERKKARRERYLLRKRAKEIAFEEAAQKLAKEMQNGDKK